jgi:hypothetical protein
VGLEQDVSRERDSDNDPKRAGQRHGSRREALTDSSLSF